MKSVARMFCVAVLLPGLAQATTPAAAPPAAGSAADRSSASQTQLDQVGRIVVPVMIDGKGPFRFLVDTGADGSVISDRLAHQLGLVPPQSAGEQVEGTTGIERMPWVTIAELRIGGIVRTNVRMPVTQSPVLAGLDGILGMAGFGDVQVAVDFRHNTVAIGPSRGLMWGYLDIPAQRTAGGLLMIPARVGGVKVEAVIDTGAEESLGNSALKAALVRAAKKAAQTRVYGVTKQVTAGGVVQSPTIYLGSAAIRNLSIVYSDIPIFKTWHLDSRPALIVGMNVLGTVDALVLDYPRARVYLLPPEEIQPTVREKDVFFPWLGGG